MTVQELERELIGHALNDGKMLYKDLWVEMAPLSALVYKFLDLIFGRSRTAHMIIAIIIYFFQIFYFNQTLLSRKAYNDNTYLPAFIYAVLGFVFVDTLRLSPELMGLTFIVISFASLFKHLEARVRTDQNLLYIGFYIGLASLFYLPYILFFLATILSLLFYTSTIARRYILLIYGVAFPIILVWIFYFIQGNTELFYYCYINALVRFDYDNLMNIYAILAIIALPTIFLLWAFVKVAQTPGFINYQSRIQGVFFFYFITSLVIWMLWSRNSGAGMIIFVPIYTFFLAHLFLLLRKWLVRELAFIVFVVCVLGVYYSGIYENTTLMKVVALDELMLKKTPYSEEVKGKKLLVMGSENFSAYKSAKPATPYLDWHLARIYFDNLGYYDHLQKIYLSLENDLPDIIIDEEGYMPRLIDRIPVFEQKYEKKEEGFYEKKAF